MALRSHTIHPTYCVHRLPFPANQGLFKVKQRHCDRNCFRESVKIMPTHFANVDLEFRSKQDISPIVKEFGDAVYVLYCDKEQDHYLASLEVASRSNEADEVDEADEVGEADEVDKTHEAAKTDADEADRAINQFCTLIESLSAEGRTLWDNCFERVFDIGYDSGITPFCYRSTLQPSTVQRIAQLGASILVTIYASDETQDERQE